MAMGWLRYSVALALAGAASVLGAAAIDADRRHPPPSAASRSPVSARDPWRSAADLFFKVAARDDAIPDAGLPRAVAQDGQGFIWLATDAGLARWDGIAFKSYTPERGPATGALPELMVNSLFADRSGRLWLGMSAEGLLWHDPATEAFRRPANRTSLDRAHVLAIRDDAAGNLWVGSDQGLAVVRGPDHRVTMVAASAASGLPAGEVRTLLVDRRGTLWVAVGARLFRRERGGGRFRAIALDIPRGTITGLIDDARGRVWVATDTSGLVVVDPSGGSHRLGVEQDGRSPVLSTMIQVGDDQIWAASRDGILAIDTASGHVRRLTHDPALPGSLPENGLNHLFRDRSGLVWVVGDATLSYVDPAPRRVLGLVSILRPQPDSAPEAAWSVGAAPDGSIWYGSADAGARRLTPSQDRSGPPVRQSAVPGARRGVTAFAFTPDHGTFTAGDDGLFVMPANRRSAIRISSARWSRLLLNGTTLYVGGNGVATLDVRRPTALKQAAWSQALSDSRVRSLAMTQDGALWVGTARGLDRVDLASGKVTAFQPHSAAAPELQANYISTLLVDRRGRLWAGTLGGGLTIFQRDGATWRSVRHLGRSDGLPHDTIDKLLRARDDHIWASTDGGIVRIDPDTLAITPLRAADGVSFVANWTGAGDVLPDGRLVFAGFGGLTLIDPAVPARTAVAAPLRFTAIDAGGHAIAPPQTGTGLTIAPAERSLTAEFALLDYASRDQTFAYRLSPLEQGWTRVDAQHRVARYTNLPPGKSTLVVVALAPAPGGRLRSVGVPLVLTLEVERRWFETTLFRVIAVLALAAAIVALFQVRMRAARSHQRRLEHLVELRTAELLVSQSELEKLAYSDTLTGLGNRRRYGEMVGRMLAQADRQPFALLLIDLDRFKQVNDELGHDTGDALLVEVADRLTGAMRQSDSIFRLGGDEFAIVVADVADAAAVEEVCRRLYVTFSQPVSAGAHMLRVALSIGAVVVDGGGQAMEAIYRRADQALYDAKNGGRGTWRIALPTEP
jgi:diguanylate cyclase (GGDEF)-like protein